MPYSINLRIGIADKCDKEGKKNASFDEGNH
jgi:hypothetical protein